MLVNATLGTVLWSSYAEMSRLLEPHLGQHPTTMAAMSGAFAGAAQALVAAPAENVRLLLEGGTVYKSWSHAWKEVFRGTVPLSDSEGVATRNNARQVRTWMKEVGEMAGRGWDGWGWGCAKDVCGVSLNAIVHRRPIEHRFRFCSLLCYLRGYSTNSYKCKSFFAGLG
jgi:hypothetical protein